MLLKFLGNLVNLELAPFHSGLFLLHFDLQLFVLVEACPSSGFKIAELKHLWKACKETVFIRDFKLTNF